MEPQDPQKPLIDLSFVGDIKKKVKPTADTTTTLGDVKPTGVLGEEYDPHQGAYMPQIPGQEVSYMPENYIGETATSRDPNERLKLWERSMVDQQEQYQGSSWLFNDRLRKAHVGGVKFLKHLEAMSTKVLQDIATNLQVQGEMSANKEMMWAAGFVHGDMKEDYQKEVLGNLRTFDESVERANNSMVVQKLGEKTRETLGEAEDIYTEQGFWNTVGGFAPMVTATAASVLSAPYTKGKSLAIIPQLARAGTTGMVALDVMGNTMMQFEDYGNSVNQYYEQHPEEDTRSDMEKIMTDPNNEYSKWGLGLLHYGIVHKSGKLMGWAGNKLVPMQNIIAEATRPVLKANPTVGGELLKKWAASNPAAKDFMALYGKKSFQQALQHGGAMTLMGAGGSFLDNIYKQPEDRIKFEEVVTNLSQMARDGAIFGMMLGPIHATNNVMYHRQRRATAGITVLQDREGNVYEKVGNDPSNQSKVMVVDKNLNTFSVDRKNIVDEISFTNKEAQMYLDAWKNGQEALPQIERGIYINYATKIAVDLTRLVATHKNGLPDKVTFVKDKQGDSYFVKDYTYSPEGTFAKVGMLVQDMGPHKATPEGKGALPGEPTVKGMQGSTHWKINWKIVKLANSDGSPAGGWVKSRELSANQFVDASVDAYKSLKGWLKPGGDETGGSGKPAGLNSGVDGVGGITEPVPPGSKVMGPDGVPMNIPANRQPGSKVDFQGRSWFVSEINPSTGDLVLEEVRPDGSLGESIQVGMMDSQLIDKPVVEPDVKIAGQEKVELDANGKPITTYKNTKTDQVITKGYIKGAIEAADSKEDVAHLQWTNDPELTKMLQTKFPEEVTQYLNGKKSINRDEAEGIIDHAKSLETLSKLKVVMDVELQTKLMARISELSGGLIPMQVPGAVTAGPKAETGVQTETAEKTETAVEAAVETETVNGETGVSTTPAPPVSETAVKKRMQEELDAIDPQSGEKKADSVANKDTKQKQKALAEGIKLIEKDPNISDETALELEEVGFNNLGKDVYDLVKEGKYEEARKKVGATYEEEINERYNAELAKLKKAAPAEKSAAPVATDPVSQEQIAIKERRRKANLPDVPEIRFQDSTAETLDMMENKEPVVNKRLKEASSDLYEEYKRLEAMKNVDKPMYTKSEIEAKQKSLENIITKLENKYNEQTEKEVFTEVKTTVSDKLFKEAKSTKEVIPQLLDRSIVSAEEFESIRGIVDPDGKLKDEIVARRYATLMKERQAAVVITSENIAEIEKSHLSLLKENGATPEELQTAQDEFNRVKTYLNEKDTEIDQSGGRSERDRREPGSISRITEAGSSEKLLGVLQGRRDLNTPGTRGQITNEEQVAGRLAPNGEKSNLSDVDHDYVRTEEFKKKFGDWQQGEGSLVLDANGEPLRVYSGKGQIHKGGISPEKTSQKVLFFTGDKSLAGDYAKGKQPVIYSGFVSITPEDLLSGSQINPLHNDQQEFIITKEAQFIPIKLERLSEKKGEIPTEEVKVPEKVKAPESPARNLDRDEMNADEFLANSSDYSRNIGFTWEYQDDPMDDVLIVHMGNRDRKDIELTRKELIEEGADLQPEIASVIEFEETKVDTNPSEAQKEAGNYRKGHFPYKGMNISIETAKGETRSGTDPDGKKWEIEMQNSYGHILGTKSNEGSPGDPLDVFLGPNMESEQVFIVDQYKKDGTFDEHKTMLGFTDPDAAMEAYKANYEQGWDRGKDITEATMDEFKEWAFKGKKTKPAFGEFIPRSVEKDLDGNPVKMASALKKMLPEYTDLFDEAVNQNDRHLAIVNQFRTGAHGESVNSRLNSKMKDEIMGFGNHGADAYFGMLRLYDQAFKKTKGYKNFDQAKFDERLQEFKDGVVASKKTLDDFEAKYTPAQIKAESDRLHAVKATMDQETKDYVKNKQNRNEGVAPGATLPKKTVKVAKVEGANEEQMAVLGSLTGLVEGSGGKIIESKHSPNMNDNLYITWESGAHKGRAIISKQGNLSNLDGSIGLIKPGKAASTSITGNQLKEEWQAVEDRITREAEAVDKKKEAYIEKRPPESNKKAYKEWQEGLFSFHDNNKTSKETAEWDLDAKHETIHLAVEDMMKEKSLVLDRDYDRSFVADVINELYTNPSDKTLKEVFEERLAEWQSDNQMHYQAEQRTIEQRDRKRHLDTRGSVSHYESNAQRKKIEMFHALERAKLYGFTEPLADENGWHNFRLPEKETIEVGKNNLIRLAQGPNGKWAVGITYGYSNGGGAHGPNIYGDPYNTREEAVAAGAKSLIDVLERELESTDHKGDQQNLPKIIQLAQKYVQKPQTKGKAEVTGTGKGSATKGATPSGSSSVKAGTTGKGKKESAFPKLNKTIAGLFDKAYGNQPISLDMVHLNTPEAISAYEGLKKILGYDPSVTTETVGDVTSREMLQKVDLITQVRNYKRAVEERGADNVQFSITTKEAISLVDDISSAILPLDKQVAVASLANVLAANHKASMTVFKNGQEMLGAYEKNKAVSISDKALVRKHIEAKALWGFWDPTTDAIYIDASSMRNGVHALATIMHEQNHSDLQGYDNYFLDVYDAFPETEMRKYMPGGYFSLNASDNYLGSEFIAHVLGQMSNSASFVATYHTGGDISKWVRQELKDYSVDQQNLIIESLNTARENGRSSKYNVTAEVEAGLHGGGSLGGHSGGPGSVSSSTGEVQSREARGIGEGADSFSAKGRKVQKANRTATPETRLDTQLELFDATDTTTRFSIGTMDAWEEKALRADPILGPTVVAVLKEAAKSDNALRAALEGDPLQETPVRTNSDYGFTMDSDTKCGKQVNFVNYNDHIFAVIGEADSYFQGKFPKLTGDKYDKKITQLRSHERWTVVHVLSRNGIDAPCPICYVETPRISKKEYGSRGGVTNVPKGYAPYAGQLLAKAGPHKVTGVEFFMLQDMRAGLRYLSATDAKPTHIIDIAQSLGDLTILKAMAHAYTKSLFFAEVFGPTGMAVNLSVYPKIINGKVRFDPSAGHKESYVERMSLLYPSNVGGMAVASTDKLVWEMLDHDLVKMIIPFHASGLRKDIYESLGMKDFSSGQKEVYKDPVRAAEDKDRIMAAVKEVGSKKLGVNYRSLDPLEKYFVDFAASNGFIGLPNTKSGMKTNDILVSGYHPPIGVKAFSGGNKEVYLDLADKYGLIPKFDAFTRHPNYMRLINDTVAGANQVPVDITKMDIAAADEVFDRFIKAGGNQVYLEVNQKIAEDAINTINLMRERGWLLGDLIKDYESKLYPEPSVRFSMGDEPPAKTLYTTMDGQEVEMSSLIEEPGKRKKKEAEVEWNSKKALWEPKKNVALSKAEKMEIEKIDSRSAEISAEMQRLTNELNTKGYSGKITDLMHELAVENGVLRDRKKVLLQLEKAQSKASSGPKPSERPSQRALKLDQGEYSNMELKYSIAKELAFNGSEKIETAGDVAFLFKSLQTAAIENMFAVGVVDGKPIILHISMGARAGTLMNFQAVQDFVSRFKPTSLYMVHNHPSGNLTPSEADLKIGQNVIDAFSKEVPDIRSLIIDVTRGLFTVFRESSRPDDTRQLPVTEPKGNVKTHKVYRFNKQAFSKNVSWEDLEKTFINRADIAVAFAGQGLSMQKYSTGNKAAILVLDRSNKIMANIHLSESDLGKLTTEEIKAYAARYQANGVIIYGKFFDDPNESMSTKLNEYETARHIRKIKAELEDAQITLLDVLNIKHRPDVVPSSSGRFEPDWREFVEDFSAGTDIGMFEPTTRYEKMAVSNNAPMLLNDLIKGVQMNAPQIAIVKEITNLSRRNESLSTTRENTPVPEPQGDLFAGEMLTNPNAESQRTAEISGEIQANSRRIDDLTKTLKRSIEENKRQGNLFAEGNESPTVQFAMAPAVEKPEFKKWFGESKVVDEKGNPLVVYHGTNSDFSTFEKGLFGFHFGNAKQADDILQRKRSYGKVTKWHDRKRGYEPGASIMPVYLKIDNPIRIPDPGNNSPFFMIRDLLALNIISPMDALRLEKLVPETKSESDKMLPKVMQEIIQTLKDKGYDGAIYQNTVEGLTGGFRKESSGDSYIAFDRTQIKSATGNVGTFSEHPNIQFSMGDSHKTAVARREFKTSEYPESMSKVMVHTNLATLKKHPWYAGAKTGRDGEASYRVAKSLVKPEVIDKMKETLNPDMPVYLVPVIQKEKLHANALPIGYAVRIAEMLGPKYKAEVIRDIVRVQDEANTGAKLSERMEREYKYVGKIPVDPKAQYVIVDDNYTSGNTVVSLAEHIMKQGGKVKIITTYSSSRYGSGLKPSEKDLQDINNIPNFAQQIEAEYGKPVEYFTGAEIQAVRRRRINVGRGAKGRSGDYVPGSDGGVSIAEGAITYNPDTELKKVTITDKRTGQAMDRWIKPLPDAVKVVNGFYSNITKNIFDFGKPAQKAKDWLNTVGKTDEAIYTGIREFLETMDPNRTVGKDELISFMNDNPMTLNEVVRGQNFIETYITEKAIEQFENGNTVYGFNPDVDTKRYSVVEDLRDLKDNYVAWAWKAESTWQTNIAQLTVESDNAHNKMVEISQKLGGSAATPYLTGSRLTWHYKTGTEFSGRQSIKEVPEEYHAELDRLQAIKDAYFRALEAADEPMMDDPNEPKYAVYTVEGKSSDYKEILMTIPIQYAGLTNSENIEYDALMTKLQQEPLDKLQERRLLQLSEKKRINEFIDNSYSDFKSAHFDERNILVHIRPDTRTVKDEFGLEEKALFLNEIQSDWAERARDNGFRDESLMKDFEKQAENQKLALYERNRKIFESKNQLMADMQDRGMHTLPSESEYREFMRKPSNADLNAREELIRMQLEQYDKDYLRYEDLTDIRDREIRSIYSDKPPKGPYVSDTNAWIKLALKMAVRDAIRRGVTKIAWTNGDQQNAMYAITKEVDSITWTGDEESVSIDVEPKDQGGITRHLGIFPIKELNGVIGKELADKIRSDINNGITEKVIEGGDLSIGGDAMQKFYGNPKIGIPGMVHGVAKKLFNQEPHVVEYNALRNTPLSRQEAFQAFKDGQQLSDAKEGEGTLYFETLDQVKNHYFDRKQPLYILNKIEYDKLWAVDLTPDLQAEFGQGMPLFSMGEPPAVEPVRDPEFAGGMFEPPVPPKDVVLMEEAMEGYKETIRKKVGDLEADVLNSAVSRMKETGGDKVELRRILENDLLTFKYDPNVRNRIQRLLDHMSSNVMPSVQFAGRPPAPPIKGTPTEGWKPGLPPPNLVTSKAQRQKAIWQNRMLSVREWQKRVLGRGGSLDELSNPYIQENLSHGAVMNAIKNYDTQQMDPLIEQAALIMEHGNMTFADLGEYMDAKHAPERNDFFEQKTGEPGVYAGMTNAEASTLVANYESKLLQSEIDDFWRLVNSATGTTLNRWFKDGFLSKEVYDELVGRWKHYVPMRGFEPDASDAIFQYQSEDVGRRISPMHKAKGRESRPDHPLKYIANMGHTAIVYGEKNKIKQYASRLVRNNPNMPDLHNFKQVFYVWDGTMNEAGKKNYFETYDRPAQELWDQGFVQTKQNIDHMIRRPKSQSMEHEVPVFIGGDKYMMILPPDVARALNKTQSSYDAAAKLLREKFNIGKYTQWLSTNFTAKNPAFIPYNQMRDLQYATLSHFLQGGPTQSAEFITHLPGARSTIIRSLDGKKGSTPQEIDMDARYEDFKTLGGETGYIHQKDVDELQRDIERDIARINDTNSMSDVVFHSAFLRKAGMWMEHMAIRSENLSRFATYSLLLDQGYSKPLAAYGAKQITVNFNTKGEVSQLMGSLYSFFNATIQGGANILGLGAGEEMGAGWDIGQTQNEPPPKDKSNKRKARIKKFAALTMGMMAIGFLDAWLNSLWQEDDETGDAPYNALSDYIKHTNLVIPFKKPNTFITIPLPHGFRWFHGLGVSSYQLLAGDARSEKAATMALSSLFSSISPVDPTQFVSKDGGPSLRPIVPTVFIPAFDIAENRDFSGQSVYKEPFTKALEGEIADVALGKDNVNPEVKAMFDFIYGTFPGKGDIKSGSEYFEGEDGKLHKVSELWDWNPSKAEHAVSYYLGGRGLFWNDVMKTTKGVAEGVVNVVSEDEEFRNVLNEVKLNDVPILKRLIRQPWGTTAYKETREVLTEIRHYEAMLSANRKAYGADSREAQPTSKWANKIALTKDLEESIDELDLQIKNTDNRKRIQEFTDIKERLFRNYLIQIHNIDEK